MNDQALDIDERSTGATGDIRKFLAFDQRARPVERGDQQNRGIEIETRESVGEATMILRTPSVRRISSSRRNGLGRRPW